MGKSHQKGWIILRGKKWYGYFRREVIDPETNQPKATIIPVVLGAKSELSKFEAKEALEREITRVTGSISNDRSAANVSVTFGWFVRNRFFPLKEADWRVETAKVKKYLIEADLIEKFDEDRLEDIDKFALQTHLNKLAKVQSRDRVLQIRAYMQAIFSEAVDQDYLSKDPARKVKVPAHLRETDKTVLTWDQLRLALMELTLQDRILLELDMTNALRPSELFAFRWKCFSYEACTLEIMELSTRARFGLGERLRRVSRSFISRGVLRTIFSNGGNNVPIHPQMPSSSRMGRVGSWTRTTTASGCFTD